MKKSTQQGIVGDRLCAQRIPDAADLLLHTLPAELPEEYETNLQIFLRNCRAAIRG